MNERLSIRHNVTIIKYEVKPPTILNRIIRFFWKWPAIRRVLYRFSLLPDNLGKIKEVKKYHNLVVNSGLNLIRDALAGDSVTFPTHMALGTGTTAEAAGDTALENEVFRDVITKTSKTGTGNVQYKYYLSSQDANGYNISEEGLFNAASVGTMFARVTFPADEKTSSEAWTFTHDVKVEVG